MPKKTKKKVVDMNSKTAKYFVNNRVKGMNKTEAALAAGSSIKSVSNLEKNQTYQELERRYARTIERKMGIDEVTDEHIKNIKQDENLNAKNKAIEMYMDRVDPKEVKKTEDDDSKMIVVLR